MKQTPLDALVEALGEGLARPVHFWTLIVILLAIAGALVVSRVVRSRTDRRLRDMENVAAASGLRADALRFSVDGVRRLAFPLSGQLLLWLGEGAMRLAGIVTASADVRLLRLAMVLMGAMAVIRMLVYVLRRTFRNLALISTFERVIATVIWVVVALHVTGVLEDTVAWLEATKLPLGAAKVSLWTVLTGGVSVLATVLVALWAGSSLEARLMGARSLDGNVRAVLSRLMRALLVLLAVLVALSLVGIDLTVLSVFGGALGVGLGLGLQRIASNYVSGFIILLDRSLRIGDLITVDKYFGTVTQINTRYTVVRAMNGTEAIVPNEMLVSTPVTNHSYSDTKVRVAVRVSVAYGTELAPTLQLLVDSASSHPRVLADPVPTAFLLGFGADGLDLEVGFWIADPEQGQLGVQSDVAQRIYAEFQRLGIHIPFPQREIRVSVPEALRTESSVPPQQKAA